MRPSGAGLDERPRQQPPDLPVPHVLRDERQPARRGLPRGDRRRRPRATAPTVMQSTRPTAHGKRHRTRDRSCQRAVRAIGQSWYRGVGAGASRGFVFSATPGGRASGARPARRRPPAETRRRARAPGRSRSASPASAMRVPRHLRPADVGLGPEARGEERRRQEHSRQRRQGVAHPREVVRVKHRLDRHRQRGDDAQQHAPRAHADHTQRRSPASPPTAPRARWPRGRRRGDPRSSPLLRRAPPSPPRWRRPGRCDGRPRARTRGWPRGCSGWAGASSSEAPTLARMGRRRGRWKPPFQQRLDHARRHRKEEQPREPAGHDLGKHGLSQQGHGSDARHGGQPDEPPAKVPEVLLQDARHREAHRRAAQGGRGRRPAKRRDFRRASGRVAHRFVGRTSGPEDLFLGDLGLA